MSRQDKQQGFERIKRILTYIHQNIEEPLSVAELAEQSCWSRWQLQRVFQEQTGSTVANYVREIKLSHAAEQLLNGESRMIDIAFSLGFSSEISFSRAFKQMFGLGPRAYKQRGQRMGLRKPLEAPRVAAHLQHPALSPVEISRLVEVRIETRPVSRLYGVSGDITGLLSPTPNFQQQVPKIWQQLYNRFDNQPSLMAQFTGQASVYGIVDTTAMTAEGDQIRYWAALEPQSEALLATLEKHRLQQVDIPAQTYAVVEHKGPAIALAQTVAWFIAEWLPESGYRGLDGYELEVYPWDYDMHSQAAKMAYWIPVTR
ncbi:AraC family transcriptional regulator [Thaumasiovibrio subtropicus]|uniref:AraC family transcriptional regulator n=1 Tax=Thaumasiovibrio subtropicus TaxID=1891207 RepID=UPI000B353FE3|nr:AraC family transcriptional regulator [Thaumasiovibrio subtropicus]